MMAARVAGVPMPPASLSMACPFGSSKLRQMFSMAAMSVPSVKNCGGFVLSSRPLTARTSQTSPFLSAGSVWASSSSSPSGSRPPAAFGFFLRFSSAALRSFSKRMRQPSTRTTRPLAVKVSPPMPSTTSVASNSCTGKNCAM